MIYMSETLTGFAGCLTAVWTTKEKKTHIFKVKFKAPLDAVKPHFQSNVLQRQKAKFQLFLKR